jgi:hypothetical protein
MKRLRCCWGYEDNNQGDQEIRSTNHPELRTFAYAVAAALADFFAAFLTFAQRACCAAAILALASGLRTRFAVVFALAGAATATLFLGRPGPFFETAPFKSAFASCNFNISASICARMLAVFNVSSALRF